MEPRLRTAREAQPRLLRGQTLRDPSTEVQSASIGARDCRLYRVPSLMSPYSRTPPEVVTANGRQRPRNIIVLDADNPMVEIRGEFVRREDVDPMIAEAREQAYRDGYRAGWADAARRGNPTSPAETRRHLLMPRLARLAGRAILRIAVLLLVVITLSALVRYLGGG